VKQLHTSPEPRPVQSLSGGMFSSAIKIV
jgi:hypothetical protein